MAAGWVGAGIGALSLLNSMSGQQGGSTTTSNSPWIQQAPYLDYGFQRANNLYGGGGNPALNPSGSTPALLQYGDQSALMRAQQALNPNSLTSQSQGLLGSTIQGNYLNPETNPYLKSSVQDALGLAGSSFAGQYGGAAGNNLGNSGYQEGLARTLGNVATNAYSNAYGQERQNQLQAMQMAPGMDFANINQLDMAGQAPWLRLQQYNQAVSGNYGGQTTQPYFTNPAASALGAGIAGGTLYNMFGKGNSSGSLFGNSNSTPNWAGGDTFGSNNG